MRDRMLNILGFLAVCVAIFGAEYQDRLVEAILIVLVGIFWALFRIASSLSRGAEWLELATRSKQEGDDA